MTAGVVALRHLVTCLDSKRVPLNSEQRSYMTGRYPYWGAGSVVDQIDRYLFDEELVLLGEDGAPFFDHERDVAFRVNEPVWVNNHIHVLRPAPSVDARYLTYALNVVDYGRYIGGSTRDKLTQDDMREIEVPSWPIGRQRRIADFLDDQVARIDHIITSRRAQAECLVAAEESELEEVLWAEAGGVELRRLGTSVTTGPFGTAFAAADYVKDGVPMINPTHIDGGALVPDPHHSVGSTTAARLLRHQLRAGDIVTGRKGDLGRSAVVQSNQAGWICGSDSIAIHPDPSQLSAIFLDLVLHLPRVRADLVSKSPGATMPSLNEGMLLSVVVPAVPLSQQATRATKGSATRQTFRDQRESLRHSVDLLSELKRALITAAMTGDFDVSVADGSRMPV